MIIFEWNNSNQMLDTCDVTEWSRFTGCSAKCGLGEKIRVRLPKVKRGRPVPHEITQLYNKLTNKNKMHSDDDFDDSDFEVMDVMDENHLCFQTGLIDRQICEVRNTPCEEDEDDDESIITPGRFEICCVSSIILIKPKFLRFLYEATTQRKL